MAEILSFAVRLLVTLAILGVVSVAFGMVLAALDISRERD